MSARTLTVWAGWRPPMTPAAPRFFPVRFEPVAPHPAPSDTETTEHPLALEGVRATTP